MQGFPEYILKIRSGMPKAVGTTAGYVPDDWNDLTSLLNSLDGSQGKQDRVYRLVYSELRRIAHRLLSGEPAPDSFQPTELLHETYLKKLRSLRVPIRNRQHFYSLATRAMRQVLIEDTRRRKAKKRQAPAATELEWIFGAGARSRDPVQLLEIASFLDHLRQIDPRAASVVNLRFFLGCSIEETAEALGLSLRNVRDDWDFAKVWLQRRLGDTAI